MCDSHWFEHRWMTWLNYFRRKCHHQIQAACQHSRQPKNILQCRILHVIVKWKELLIDTLSLHDLTLDDVLCFPMHVKGREGSLCQPQHNILKSDLYYKTITRYCNKGGNSWTQPPATAEVKINTQGRRYLYQLWQSGHIPLLCAVWQAFPHGKLVVTVDTAAKMAPLTTATKGMERQHMGWDRGEGGGRAEKTFSEWMAGEVEETWTCISSVCRLCVCVCEKKRERQTETGKRM